MRHQEYIDQAALLAVQNVKEGGKPFGAIIVKEGKVVATGKNQAEQTGDITAHAELEAIRKATQDRGQDSLEGASLYASGHPCPMCLSAIYLAGIREVFYAFGLDAATEVGLGVSHIYDELKKKPSERKIPFKKLQSTMPEDPLLVWKKHKQ